jgi:hypothetical protein
MERVLVRNAADENQVSKSEKKENYRARQKIDDYEFLLSSINGRRFLWGLLELCGVFSAGMSGDNYTYFYAGQRSIGTTILKDIMEIDPDAFAKMMKEKEV